METTNAKEQAKQRFIELAKLLKLGKREQALKLLKKKKEVIEDDKR